MQFIVRFLQSCLTTYYSTPVKQWYELFWCIFPIAEYENEEIPKIHLTAEEPQEKNVENVRPLCQIIKIRSFFLPQWQGDQCMSSQLSHTHWLVILLMSWTMIMLQLHNQIQVSIALIGMVRTPSPEFIVLAKQWGITLDKAKKTIQATTQKVIPMMLHPSLSRWFKMNDHNFCYHQLAHPVFSDTMFASTVSRRGNRCAQEYATDFVWASAFPMASRSECCCCVQWIASHQLVFATILRRSEAQRCCMSVETFEAIYSLVKCCSKIH